MLIHAATDNDIHPPTFGGPQRTFGLLRGLARAHDVRALCVVPNRCTGSPEERVDGVTIVRRKAWYTSAVWRLERAGLAPMFLAADAHALGAAAFARALGGPADVLLADLNLASLLAAHGAGYKVHTSHNVEYDLFRTAGAKVAAPRWWAAHRRAAEARAVAMADLTVVCSDEDAKRMRELYGVPEGSLSVAPNGYDETRVHPPSAVEREHPRAALGFGERDYVALFLGSDVPHNRAALAALTDRVLPPLAGSGVRLLVAGAVSRAVAGRREPWLAVHPEAPDIGPVLHAADAGLNPVSGGGGSNIKVPTYLAAGLAVITTPFGLRGYPALRPLVREAAIADMPEALRARPAGWHARGEAEPPEVAAHAWGRIGEQLGRELEQRIRARASAPADGGRGTASVPVSQGVAGGGR
jgi:glycosyltransferase involved in cell wall biosynthesis